MRSAFYGHSDYLIAIYITMILVSLAFRHNVTPMRFPTGVANSHCY